MYTIYCSPVTRGRHEVNVQVNDVHIDSTSLVIPFNPYLDCINSVRTIYELNRPWGLDVTCDGHIIVSECSGDCVTILDRDGKKVKSFGQVSENVEFFYPHGIAITPNNFIIVTDKHKIQKISMDGKCIESVGYRPMEFIWFKQN